MKVIILDDNFLEISVTNSIIGSCNYMGGTFLAIAGFQDSDFCQKAVKMVLRCVSNLIWHLSGFKL